MRSHLTSLNIPEDRIHMLGKVAVKLRPQVLFPGRLKIFPPTPATHILIPPTPLGLLERIGMPPVQEEGGFKDIDKHLEYNHLALCLSSRERSRASWGIVLHL